jgi:hypothetical protein
MISLKSPSNYNELLEQLNKITFFSSFIFFVFMSIYGYTPIINISAELLPAAKDQDSLLKWIVSFGLVPITFASIAFLASFSLEAHNLLAKLLGVRYFWDRSIAKRALRISRVERNVTRALVKSFMKDVYYKEIETVSEHYTQLFWRYTLSFWALFEHFFVALFTVAYLWALHPERVDRQLLMYIFWLLAFMLFHWIFIASRKSYSQVEQLEQKKIFDFFKNYPVDE